MSNTDLDTFLEHYVICALWLSSDLNSDDENDDTSLRDLGCDIDDIHPDTLASMRADCEDFLSLDSWKEAYSAGAWTLEQGGHDFWLTRNGHGTGFWDRYWSSEEEFYDLGRRLTDDSKIYGSCYLEVGDDERIYLR
jgi:hypothetical protein